MHVCARACVCVCVHAYVRACACMHVFQELYIVPYDKITWPSERSNIAECDLYTPHSWMLSAVHGMDITM